MGHRESENKGDIILFRRFDDLIVSRAVEKTLNDDGTYSFKTWGDSNLWADSRLVQENDIVGIVIKIIPSS